MNVNFFKRNFTGDIQPEHQHATDPWIENFAASFHQAQRIKLLKSLPVRVIQRGVRPRAAAKPSVESIWVASIGFITDCNRFLANALIINPVVWLVDILKGRNRNSPSNLPADVPV